MVSDIAKRLGKKVDFQIKGKDITFNKDDLNVLQDALVHLLRNSMDHGIEKPEERVKSGKRDEGLLELICEEDNSTKSITIKDDGRGINSQGVINKASQNKLVTEEKLKNMDDQEIYNLIFLPNFSTKESVTDISGRGVGMDVVKNNVEELGGKIVINSQEGQGTTFTITFNKKT